MPFELAGINQNQNLADLLGALEIAGLFDDGAADYYVGDDYDDVGDDYYVGDDLVDYMIGAKRSRRTPARAPARGGFAPRPAQRVMGARRASSGAAALRQQIGAALANRLAQSQQVVIDKGVQNDGDLPLGFDSGAAIGAGASAAITTNPQTLFAPRNLIVPASIASLFTIDDIKVGNRSQLPNSTSIAAETFSQLANQGASVRFKTAQTTMAITLNVTNISGGAARFRATMVGPAAS